MIYVVEAYGRTYFEKEDVQADWDAGKDFKMLNETYSYINKSDSDKYANLETITYMWKCGHQQVLKQNVM